VINLESARRSEWARFTHDARLPGVAEAVIDLERLTLQFLGDLGVLDRLDGLAAEFARIDDSSRAALVQAEVASAHKHERLWAHIKRHSLAGSR